LVTGAAVNVMMMPTVGTASERRRAALKQAAE
jgi:hypothetical protein